MTPDTVFTPSHRARIAPGRGTADLSAIRRTDAIIDLLASRRLRKPSVLHDPAILALSALVADVDTAPAPGAGRPPVAGGDRQQPGPEPGTANQSVGEVVRTVAAAALVATVVAAATTTGMAVSGVLMRLARQVADPPGSGHARPWWVAVLPGQPRRR